MSRILVTGGIGFLGSNLCDRLLAEGHSVIALDNMYTSRKKNLDRLSKSKNFEFINHDVQEPYFVEADQIYNLACPASPIHYQSDPVFTITTSFSGALNALRLAEKLGATILQASTSEVYGDPSVHPQHEEYWGNVNPNGIRSCYDEGKRAAESLFFDFYRKHNTNIKVARIFNTYGPNMQLNDGRVVSNFIIQALQNQDITIYGDGLQTRSFCFVDDLIDGLVKLMNSERTITGPINIGNPVEITMLTLAREIIELTQSRSKILKVDSPEDDPLQRNPDISKARSLLLWEPEIALQEGLQRTITYFKGEL
jgi:UDP-glucuronate decarboxylase